VLPRVKLKAVILTRLGDLLSFPRSHLVNWYARLGHRRRPLRPIPGALYFLQVLEEGSLLRFARPRLGPSDTALIQYTGGTTGLAKGAVLSHGNLLANVEQCDTWIKGGLRGARALRDGEETMLTALPLYHIFALTVDLLCFTRLGACNYLVPNPRDLTRLVRQLQSIRITAFAGVNTLFKGLLDTPGFDGLDFSGLKFVIGGGMATEAEVARRWLETTGVPITEGYGLTEVSPVVTINPPGAVEFTGSIGLPLPSTECGIRDEQGQPLPVGTAGELWVRGPQVMRGYWNRPEDTTDTLTPDGWLRTGDVARMDERGYLYLVDRRKDMILVSGFNVYPSEIEAVLSAHPAVRECAAVGVPDPRTGEAVKVFVVPRTEGLDTDAVRLHCRTHLAAYKVPKHVAFLEELPKTAIGKILRRELRDRKP
jgi:long-chain acyl-CoA synthetase